MVYPGDSLISSQHSRNTVSNVIDVGRLLSLFFFYTHCADIGIRSASSLCDPETGRSRGFQVAFVTLFSSAEADHDGAVDGMNEFEYELHGRRI